MNRLSPTPNLCVRQRAQSLCALSFYKPGHSASPVLVPYIYVPLFSLSARYCALPQSSHTSLRRTFPQLNLHKARVRRKPRAASFKRLYRTRAEHRARLNSFVKTRLR